jgi:hypothetical protein
VVQLGHQQAPAPLRRVPLAAAPRQVLRGAGQGAGRGARFPHAARHRRRRVAAPERRGAVGQGPQGGGDALGVPQGREQAGQQQAAVDEGGRRQGPAQRRFDLGDRHRHHHAPTRARHGRPSGAHRHAFPRNGGEGRFPGGDGRQRGGHGEAADRLLGVEAAGHERAAPVHHRSEPARRKVLLGQHPVQRLRPEAHVEVKGDPAVEADRHVHGDQRLPGHRGDVEVRHLRLAGGEDARHHAQVAARRQGRAEGLHGVQQHPPRAVGKHDARAFRQGDVPEPGVEAREVAGVEVRRGGEHLEHRARKVQLALHRGRDGFGAGRQAALRGRPARFPSADRRQHGNQQGREHHAEHKGEQARAHGRLGPGEAAAAPPGGPDRADSRRMARRGYI